MPSVHVELQPHPGDPRPASVGIDADVERTAAGLEIRYQLQGDLASIAWPEAAAPRRGNELWRHTCFEAFCAVAGGSAYYEFNFSPAGAWAAYRFGGYRERLADPELRSPPAIVVSEVGGAVQVGVQLDTTGLPRLAAYAPIELALAAVIEGRDGTIHHFALEHPAEQADFHDRRGFLVTLAGIGRRGR